MYMCVTKKSVTTEIVTTRLSPGPCDTPPPAKLKVVRGVSDSEIVYRRNEPLVVIKEHSGDHAVNVNKRLFPWATPPPPEIPLSPIFRAASSPQLLIASDAIICPILESPGTSPLPANTGHKYPELTEADLVEYCFNAERNHFRNKKLKKEKESSDADDTDNAPNGSPTDTASFD